MPKKKFGSTLDKPIKIKALIPFSVINQGKIMEQNSEIKKKNTKRVLTERVKKLCLLLDRYKIDKVDEARWFKLSLGLFNKILCPSFLTPQTFHKKSG